MQETITIRPTIPKAHLRKRAGGNLNRWINSLIENAVGEQKQGWDAFFDKPRRRVKRSVADEVRRLNR